jgi:phage tail protein X
MNRYQDIKILTDSLVKPGVRFYTTTRNPEIALSENDIYVITTQGDRLDLLAQQYYGDTTLYWIISAANDNLTKNSLFIPEGTQVRIPTNTGQVITQFNILNSL